MLTPVLCTLQTEELRYECRVETIHTIHIIILHYYQVYLVTGGWDGSNRFSSTETYSPGDTRWRQSTPLPHWMWGHRAVTLGNIVYITGEIILVIFY